METEMLGPNIRAERARIGISQQEMADRLTGRGAKTSADTVRSWEKGETEPRFSDLVAMSAIFGRPLCDWLPDVAAPEPAGARA